MPPTTPPRRPRLCAVGGAVVDHYPDLGLAFPGGNAPNVAVHAARSGAASAFIGVVGDDPAGRLIRESLDAEGVDISRLRVVAGATPVVTVRCDETGDFYSAACPRQVLPFSPTIDSVRPLAFDLIHLPATARATALAPFWAEVAPLCYDFGAGPADAELLPLITHAALSRPGMTEPEAAAMAVGLQRRGPHLVVLTRGAAGVIACRDGEVCHRPAAPAADTIDTLGAGDAHLAHLLVRLLSGDDLAPALAAAGDYAAAACTRHGGFGHGRPEAEILAGR